MLRNYLTIAFRNLWRNKTYSVINIGGLAFGIACCLLIALYMYDEYSYDLFHANYDYIYRVVEKQQQPARIFDVAVTPAPLAPALAKDFPEVVQTTRVGRWSGLLSQGKQSMEPEQLLIVDASFFNLFSFPLVAGNSNRVFQGPHEIIFSEAMAERFFGTDWRRQPVLGQSITFNNEQTLTLVGIAQNPPARSHIQFDALLPFKWVERYDEWNLKWNSNSYHTYAQLRPEAYGQPAGAAAFGEKIKELLKRYDAGNATQLFLQPLSAIYLQSEFAFETDWGKRSSILYIRIFGAVGLMVLGIAVINFINLATARATQRAREVGVRKTLGARRSDLIGQFWGEALLMTGLAFVAALLLAEILTPLFNGLAGKTLTITYQLPVFWMVLLGLPILISGLTGLYPAFILSSFRPVQVLKGITAIREGRKFRQVLVIGQFVLSISMAIGTVVIYQQLQFMQYTRLGFDQSQLLYVQLKGDLRGKALLLKREIAQIPGVAQASVATSHLVDMMNQSDIEWEGQLPKDEFLITHMNVDADFVKTAGMSLVAGRDFSSQITTDTSSKYGAYLINETAAKRMGWTPAAALGKTVKLWGAEGQVVGVLKDFHFRPLRVPIEPFIFRFRPDNYYFKLLVKTKPGTVPRTLTEIEKAYKKLDASNPFTYGFVDQDLDAQYRAEQRIGKIVLCFAILSILISCLGLFGLATYTAERRVKEIGIRKVLGASVGNIVALLSKEFVRLVVLAFVIAAPLAGYAMRRWLEDYPYRIAITWWVFVFAGAMSLLIALLTVSFQSIKAALTNPVKSLRSE